MASMHQRPRPALAPIVVVAALAALIVLVAPSTGAWHDGLRDPQFTLGQDEDPSPPPPDHHDYGGLEPLEELAEASSPTTLSPIWGHIASALAGLLLVAAVGTVVWLLLRYFRSRNEEDEDVEELRVDVQVPDEAPISAMEEASRRAFDELHRAAEPGDAIIRAWLVLQDAAAESGLRRRPSDTPTDLTMLVLDRTRADPKAARGLLRLYHRARFGTAPMTEADQETALTHLQVLAASWDAVDRHASSRAGSGEPNEAHP